MPILKVNYKINNVCVGYNKTLKSVVLEITTNGSISQKMLFEKLLKNSTWFNVFTKEHNEIPEPEQILQHNKQQRLY